jgi:hypothetical protein
VGFAAGGIQQSTFRRNDFGTVSLSPNLRGYWSKVGNTWDGSAEPPPEELPPAPRCDDAAGGSEGGTSRPARRAAPAADRSAAAARVPEGDAGAREAADRGSPPAGGADGASARPPYGSAGDAGFGTAVLEGSAAASDHPGTWGDVNRDGAVSTSDALVVLRHVEGRDPDGQDLSLADVDGDSLVTADDAAVILDYTVGLETGEARVGRPAD